MGCMQSAPMTIRPSPGGQATSLEVSMLREMQFPQPDSLLRSVASTICTHRYRTNKNTLVLTTNYFPPVAKKVAQSQAQLLVRKLASHHLAQSNHSDFQTQLFGQADKTVLFLPIEY